MTKNQCMAKIKEMLKKDGIILIIQESERLLKSGAIDISQDHKDSYAAAKCVLNVALNNVAFQFKPLGNEWIKKTQNLRQF